MGTLFKFPMLPTRTFMANPIAIGEAELRWVEGAAAGRREALEGGCSA
jgi:hypothetical protein